jgi:predicted Zn-dependent protease
MITRLPQVRQWHFAALLIIFTVAFVGCSVSHNPVSGRQRAFGYTWAQERALGAQADEQIQREFGVYPDEALAAYVDRIGQEVLQNSHMRRPDTRQEFRETPFVFRVLDSPVVNAFALPGGFIYVTRGLLAHMQNEAQLAMVLGHEITHVAARHASRRAFEAQLGQVALIGGAVAGQAVLGLPGERILDLGGVAAQLLFLSYGRGDEREADRLGVEYAALTGYQAGEGAAFFAVLRRLGEQAGQAIPTFLSTHPDPGEREQTILAMAQEWAQRTDMTIVRQNELFNNIQGMVLGDDPRQGFVEGGLYRHPELRFRFPVIPQWRVINQPTQVAMVEPNQRAIAVLSIVQGATSAQAAAQQLARQEGLTVVSQSSTVIGGFPAFYLLIDARMQNGQEVRVASYHIEYGGRVYSFLGYAPRNVFDTYQPAIVNAIQGFQAETDQRVLGIQPTRVQVVAAPRTAAFRTFIPATLPQGVTAEGLAIMNHVTLDQVIQTGTPLKLPQ